MNVRRYIGRIACHEPHDADSRSPDRPEHVPWGGRMIVGGYPQHDQADSLAPSPTAVTAPRLVRIETANACLVLSVDAQNRLLQGHFGSKSQSAEQARPAYPVGGNGWTFEPAFQVVHFDGNTSSDLRVANIERDGPSTRIELKDAAYDLAATLCYRVVADCDVVESWVEIRNGEARPVLLQRFASSSPDFGKGDFWLTQFHGDWADEANIAEEKLGYGIKILDSKLGVRAHQFCAPWFLLARGGAAQEDRGEVFGGSLAWSGSFQFAFEKLPDGRLRATCGINPFASQYRLEPGETFATPKMTWGWSDRGTGELSRKLHRYVRSEVLRDGGEPRAVLLNNWEATYFSFDEKKIVSLFDGAKDLGMELFLLDDGWFGRKYPRDDDTQGLGDWETDPKKLPNGIGALTSEARNRGLRFGIWLEPEMVNPRSELFQTHPDWAIRQPGRELELQRHQLILDLSNPDVEEYVFGVCHRTLSENPDITYVKWDCNRYVTQPGSAYLGADRQSHLWVDYVRALYRIMERLAKEHPNVQIMMCSGGGGRVDYGAMRYAQEYWPSDMTDPAKRVFIQWGYSFFFPTLATAAHVTDMGKKPIKFAFDVAMSGRLGMDMDVDGLSPEDREFAKAAIAAYKGVRDVVQLGEQYRLESPYDGPRSAVMNVLGERSVVFVYSLGESHASPLVLKGLSPETSYRVKELCPPGCAKGLEATLSGRELTTSGLPLPSYGLYGSAVFELSAF